MLQRRSALLATRTFVLLLLVGVLDARAQSGALTREQMATFLSSARIVASKELGKGVTRPLRLTLTDGTLKHDAVFQAVNERKMSVQFARGGGELNFVDSYMYNLAAYRLAELLGLDHMMPVMVERSWRGNPGALSWFLDNAFDEGERLKRKLDPPNPQEWNHQMFRMRVFGQLVYDTDRNLGNAMIGEDWKLWMIDFTRAFRLHTQLKAPGDILRCDRALLSKLRSLTLDQVRTQTKQYLTGPEINAVMDRRALIVKHFDALIAAKGEAAVLY